MQPGYQQGSESTWWWLVAKHLDDAQLALANAMAHNVDDPRPVQALYVRLREGQAILLDIFRMKGLLPAAPPKAGRPEPGMSGPPVPSGPEIPGAGAPPAGDGSPPVEQPLAHDEPAVPIAEHGVASEPVSSSTSESESGPEAEPPLAAASNGVHSEAASSEAAPSEPSAPTPDPTVEGAGG